MSNCLILGPQVADAEGVGVLRSCASATVAVQRYVRNSNLSIGIWWVGYAMLKLHERSRQHLRLSF
jgi:hypothetical protein